MAALPGGVTGSIDFRLGRAEDGVECLFEVLRVPSFLHLGLDEA
jgi:hypothetical protein